MNSTSVSVVIPTYNYGHFVVGAVESVLAQTYPNVEIIIVDDGSRDDTKARLEPFMGRIRYIYQDNQGLSAARNTGIGAATGQWIAFLDSDDSWHPRKLELQMAYLDGHPEVGLLATQYFTNLSSGWPDIAEQELPVQQFSLDDIVIRSRFGPSTVIVSRKCVEEAGRFDVALRSVEDRDLWIRIASRYPVVKLELPLCWYRIHSASMNHVPDKTISFEWLVLRRAFAQNPLLHRKWSTRLKAYSYWQLGVLHL